MSQCTAWVVVPTWRYNSQKNTSFLKTTRNSVVTTPVYSKRKRIYPPLCMSEEDISKSNDESGDTGINWDESWKRYDQNRRGGVFKLPEDYRTTKPRDVGDERVEKLTSAWSNDAGFLAGIGVILLIAAFYAYVYATGGIAN